MPAILAPLASSVLSGPISSIVGGVVSSLAGGIGGAQGAQGNSPLGGIFSFASNLIGGLLGQKPGGGLRPPSGFPSPFQLPQSIFQNLGNVLQGIGGTVNNASQGLGGILAILQKVLGGQQQTGQAGQTPFFPSIPSQNPGSGAPRTDYSRVLNEKADSLMNKARVLSTSDNPADQLKSQLLMQAAQRLRNGAADPGFRIQNPAAQPLLNQAFNLMQSDNPADQIKAHRLLQQAQGMGQGSVDPAFRYDRGVGIISDARQDGKISGQGLDATIDRVGNKAQSLMDQAQDLAASDNPADQMKAQRIMQQAQRMMEFMSGMIKIIGDMQKNAIQNMR